MGFVFGSASERTRAKPRAFVPAIANGRGANAPPPALKTGACACGGGCPRCRKGPETALPIGKPDDAHEKEANRIAEQVTATPRAGAALPGEKPRTPQVQAKPGNAVPDSGWLAQRIMQDRGGRPLPSATRDFMETRLGADFSHVRVHHGTEAQRLNADLKARAFTFGADIWLGAHESVHDRKLMAHELSHVVQQRAGPAYIARMPKDDNDSTGGTNTASYSGCDRATTGIDNAADVLDRARATAIAAVAAARAAFKPMKSSTITLLDRHFHCPSTTNMMEIMKTLAAIESALPNMPVNCRPAKDPDCVDTKGFAKDNVKELNTCPPYFAADLTDVWRAVTFIFAAATGLGRTARCRRGEGCYDDFTQTASVMLNNPYSYAWFAVEVAGLSTPDAGIVPCRPLETGIYVVVPAAAQKDPTQIRRLSGFDPMPKDAKILSVYRDSVGKYFIYDDNIDGARVYMPDEGKRYYFPEGKRP